MGKSTVTLFCLAGIGFSLILVGLVSNTLSRHLFQITPLAFALIVSRKWLAPAALPLFLFWLTIMVLIWLFLLGIARVVSGHFTLIEILLTILMGILSVTGIIFSSRNLTIERWPLKILIFVLFLVLQVAAMKLSMGG